MSYLQAAKRTGCVVEVIPEDAEGQVDVAALEGMVDARTKLIAISHVPTSSAPHPTPSSGHCLCSHLVR